MPDGTVIATGLNLRASLDPGEVVKVLRRSSKLEILGEETWYRVRTRDGLEGFVAGQFVEKDLEEMTDRPIEVDPDLPSRECVLGLYQHERYVGDPITADRDFFPLLDRIAGFAARNRLFIFVTSSTRHPDMEVRGAIVTPAKRSNHFVGHAIDMNLQAESGEFFNSSKLKKLDDQPEDVRNFIGLLRDDPILRWGGDFRAKDVVHIDDALNHRHPDIWQAKLESRG